MTKSTDDHASGQKKINDRLHQALDELRKDATRVEIWATALGTFAQPVPEYKPNEKFRLGTGAAKDAK